MATKKIPLIEVCVEGIDGLLAAQAAGADRVELCASLVEGGITPSFGTVREALALATIPFHVIVRPRGGDFLYSAAEFASMVADVAALRDLGVAGVVVGCLSADGTIDEARMRALVEAAGPLAVTCHRAFDMTRDPAEALEALVRAGVGRVLTSGQRDTAAEGAELLAALVGQAGERIIILGCGAPRSRQHRGRARQDWTRRTALCRAQGRAERHALPQPPGRHGRHRSRPRVPQHGDRRRAGEGDDRGRTLRMTIAPRRAPMSSTFRIRYR